MMCWPLKTIGEPDIIPLNFKNAITEPENVIAPTAAPIDISIKLPSLIFPGVPKLNASIGIYYNNGDTSNEGITQQKVLDIFTGKVTDIKEGRNLGDYSISGYSKDMTFRLKIKDDNWGGFYSDTFKGVEYYVKILDLGIHLL